MDSRDINKTFMQLQLRAEKLEQSEIVSTFVDAEPLVTLLQRTDHQVIYGRRGTGKTHLLSYAQGQRQIEGHLVFFIDLRSMGSNGAIYNDQNATLGERATRLLADVLIEIHNQAIAYAISNLDPSALDRMTHAVDALAEAASTVKIVGNHEEEHISGVKEFSGKKFDGGISSKPKLEMEVRQSSERDTKVSQKSSGTQVNRVVIGRAGDALRDLVLAAGAEKTWLFLDEWSAIPADVQPYLADLLRRAAFPVRHLSVKIAAIEQRSHFKLALPKGEYIGIELGADITADVNLDEFMVFDSNQERARSFFADLVFNHFHKLAPESEISTAAKLIATAFTQVNVFDEFVRASEGVARDALNILSLAAQRSMESRISMNSIRDAARTWYQRDKERPATVKPETDFLLRWLIDQVISHKKARAFLLRNDVTHPLIEELFDSRILHFLKRNISAKEAGARYDAYKLDYGCYVDLTNTSDATQGSFLLDDNSYSDVPPDDYRSIRRAVLNIEEFDAALKARLPSQN